MKRIKTRNSVKNIKALDKGGGLSKRMKDSYVRMKEHSREQKDPHCATPVEYASEKIKNSAQEAAQETVSHLPKPRDIPGHGHFAEIGRDMPKEQVRVTGQTWKTPVQAKINAGKSGGPVRYAKQRFRESRRKRYQALREDNQKAGKKFSTTMPAGKPAQADGTAVYSASPSGSFRPVYRKRNAHAPEKSPGRAFISTRKGINEASGRTVKTDRKTIKTAEQSAKVKAGTDRRVAKTAPAIIPVVITAKAAGRAASVVSKTTAYTAKPRTYHRRAQVWVVSHNDPVCGDYDLLHRPKCRSDESQEDLVRAFLFY